MASSKELCDCYHSLTAFCIFIKGLLSNQKLEEQLTVTFHDIHWPKPHDQLNFANKKEMLSLNCWLKWEHSHQFLRQSKLWRDPQLPNYSRNFLSWLQLWFEGGDDAFFNCVLVEKVFMSQRPGSYLYVFANRVRLFMV